MPEGRKFIDAGGMKGRAYLAPRQETIITGRLSKSYNKALDDSSKRLHIKRTSEGFVFNFDKIVGRRLVVKVKDMKKLAQWILEGDVK